MYYPKHIHIQLWVCKITLRLDLLEGFTELKKCCYPVRFIIVKRYGFKMNKGKR